MLCSRPIDPVVSCVRRRRLFLKCFHFKPGAAAETLFYLILILCVKTQTPAVRNVPGHRVGLGLWFASDFEAAGEFELAH